MPSEQVLAKVDDVVPQGVTHIGFLLVDLKGRLAVVQPSHSPYGVTATLPRVRLNQGETASRGLRRCFEERSGVVPLSSFPIETVWITPNSSTYFFAGCVLADGAELKGETRWLSPENAERVIAASKYAPTRQRDLGALERAQRICLSPYRRVLEMVRELHGLGYERLRAPAYMYPLAWRCPVVPSSWTLREHGGMFHEVQLNFALAGEPGSTTYSSASEQDALFGDFPMTNIEFATPRELADGFVRLRPAIATAGWGPDPEYAAWLQEALRMLGPHGIYYAFEEYQPPRETLYTSFSATKSLRLPPPGQSSRSEWEEFERRSQAN